ncbi:MAG: preprotein translocase subunit SecG [Gammaproteobacteria bacterium]|nr:preprotein translocase subunit SecG [Gammaproteobacteria bacterium]
MYEALLVIYLLVAIALIALVLIQQGKGADMGASFGAGSSATIFGSSGAGNFLTRSTAVLATLFFLLSLVLGNLTASRVTQEQEWSELGDAAPTAIEQPVSGDTAVEKTEQPSSELPQ